MAKMEVAEESGVNRYVCTLPIAIRSPIERKQHLPALQPTMSPLKPTLDLSLFTEGGTSARQDFAAQLLDNLSADGFVKIGGHGISEATVAELFESVSTTHPPTPSARKLKESAHLEQNLLRPPPLNQDRHSPPRRLRPPARILPRRSRKQLHAIPQRPAENPNDRRPPRRTGTEESPSPSVFPAPF